MTDSTKQINHSRGFLSLGLPVEMALGESVELVFLLMNNYLELSRQ